MADDLQEQIDDLEEQNNSLEDELSEARADLQEAVSDAEVLTQVAQKRADKIRDVLLEPDERFAR